MGTKKFKLGNADGKNVKGGKNNTRTILTAAGIIAAGGAGYAVGDIHGDNEDIDTETEEQVEEQSEERTEEKSDEQQEVQQSDTNESQQTIQHPQPQSVDDITEPQPTDSVQTQQSVNDEGQEFVETDPNLIAQQIIAEQNIDPDDIDNPAIISVDELATIYREDGSEMLVAVVHTPDGAQYLLADIDGDGFFTDVFDLAGNYMGEAEGNLMASDLEAMADETGSYLAQTMEELQGDDPTNDIIITPNPTYEDIAENSVTAPMLDGEEVSGEELLAQLLENEENEEEHLVDETLGDYSQDDYDDDVDHEDIYG